MTRTLLALALALSLGACADNPTAESPTGASARPEASEASEADEPDDADAMAVAPPSAVVQAFQAGHAGATGLAWSMEDGGYEASFTEGGTDMSVVYAADGTAGATETTISVSDLPAAVTAALARDYAGQTVNEAARIVDGAETTYEAEVTQDGAATDLVFRADGTLVKTETD